MLNHEFLESGMRQAAAEARRWMGLSSSPVGAAALNSAGRILAVAAHHHDGAKHAEALLLDLCREQGSLPQIDTLCVTLEPCNHHGRTPPCTDAVIAAGIKRIAIGIRDPNPHVKGGGIKRLQTAGIEVALGIAEEECRQSMHAFIHHMQTDKPWITIKRAFDAEGSMIPLAGQKTFSSPASLKLAHSLRKKAGAILTGSGTILADHPLFTVRHVADHLGKRRWLAILDRRGRIPRAYTKAAETRGLDVIIYRDIAEALHDLAEKGVQDVLVEAGPALSQSLLDSGLWNMSVTIRHADPDGIDVTFNPHVPAPFDTAQFRWDYFLPQEEV